MNLEIRLRMSEKLEKIGRAGTLFLVTAMLLTGCDREAQPTVANPLDEPTPALTLDEQPSPTPPVELREKVEIDRSNYGEQYETFLRQLNAHLPNLVRSISGDRPAIEVSIPPENIPVVVSFVVQTQTYGKLSVTLYPDITGSTLWQKSSPSSDIGHGVLYIPIDPEITATGVKGSVRLSTNAPDGDFIGFNPDKLRQEVLSGEVEPNSYQIFTVEEAKAANLPILSGSTSTHYGVSIPTNAKWSQVKDFFELGVIMQ